MYDERHFITDIWHIVNKMVQEGISVQTFRSPSRQIDLDALESGDPQDFISASQTALELGHPTSSSIFMGMATGQDNFIKDSHVTILGKPIPDLPPGRHSIALILFLKVTEVSEGACRDLNKYILSCNGLGGVMVRMSSGKIWLRFTSEGLKRGLTLEALGRHIIKQIKDDGDRCEATEVMFVIGERNHIERLRPVVEKQTKVRSDFYRAVMAEKMACETGLDCGDCDENETCKVLRKAVGVARQK